MGLYSDQGWGVQLAGQHKIQATVSSILPSATAIFGYAIGPQHLQLTDSFLLVLKWQNVCSRQLKLYQTFLL